VNRPANVSLPDLVAKARSGVIKIYATNCSGEDEGTGFLLDAHHVATVEHVVDGATSISLVRSGKQLGSATVVGADAARDLALLRTSTPIEGYHFAISSRAPRLAEGVAVLGFPLDLPLSVSTGLVSGSDRTVAIDGINRRHLIQTDAAVNPGNSGGPLISTSTGEVIGLVDLKNIEASGLAFAVSGQVAAPLLVGWNVAPQPLAATTCQSALPPVAAPAQTSPPSPGGGAPAAPDLIKQTIVDHWQAINAGNYQLAFSLFSPSYQALVGESGWLANKRLDQPTSTPIAFGTTQVAGTTGSVQVNFNTFGLLTSANPRNTGCNAWSGNYKMAELSGTWYIDGAQLTRTPLDCAAYGH
jgi:hypothetical protein